MTQYAIVQVGDVGLQCLINFVSSLPPFQFPISKSKISCFILEMYYSANAVVSNLRYDVNIYDVRYSRIDAVI